MARAMWRRFCDVVTTLFEEYKLARRLLLFWAISLITYTVIRFFEPNRVIEEAHATVIVAIVGVLAVVIGFYQWSRNKDDDG